MPPVLWVIQDDCCFGSTIKLNIEPGCCRLAPIQRGDPKNETDVISSKWGQAEITYQVVPNAVINLLNGSQGNFIASQDPVRNLYAKVAAFVAPQAACAGSKMLIAANVKCREGTVDAGVGG